jgi:hypothetical protein
MKGVLYDQKTTGVRDGDDRACTVAGAVHRADTKTVEFAAVVESASPGDATTSAGDESATVTESAIHRGAANGQRW